MTWKAIILAIAGFLTGIPSLLGQNGKEPDNRRIYRVSLIQVIANPKDFDGQHLRIVGYLGPNGVDRAIGVFVSEVDGRNFVSLNSVDLHLESSQVSNLIGKYVVLSGQYHAPPIPWSGYNGYIDKILEIKERHYTHTGSTTLNKTPSKSDSND